MDKYTAEHILGLSETYDARELKAAFRKLAATYHPDAAQAKGTDTQTATAKMQEINEANDYLAGLIPPGETLRCEPAPQTTGHGWDTAQNPFDGSRPQPGQRQARTTTRDWYAADAGNRAAAESRERRAQAARENPYRKAWEEASKVPEPENAALRNPRWFSPLWRAVARFPYRIAFLALICMLTSFTAPMYDGSMMGPLSFEDALLGLALLNLLFPIVTDPLRWLLLSVLKGARAIHMKLHGNAGD